MFIESFSLPTLFQWANKTIGHSKSNNSNSNNNKSLEDKEHSNTQREKKLKRSPKSTATTYYLDRMIVDSPNLASSSTYPIDVNCDPLDLNDDGYLSPSTLKMMFEQSHHFQQQHIHNGNENDNNNNNGSKAELENYQYNYSKSKQSLSPFCFLKSNSKKSTFSKRFNNKKHIVIEELPIEVIIHILGYLNFRDIGYSLPLVNRNFRDICSVFVLWKNLYTKYWSKKGAKKASKFHNIYGYVPSSIKSSPLLSPSLKYSSNKNYKKMYQMRHIVEKNWKKGVCSVQTLYGHQESVWGVQFHGDTLVSGAEDGVMKVWDINEGECKHTLVGHTDVINSFHFEGDRVASGSDDSTLKVWKASTGQCVNTFTGHAGSVWMLEFRDNFLVSGGDDRSVRLWDMNTGQQIQSHTGHTGRIYYVQMGENSIVSGAQDKSCRIWDVRSGKPSHTMVSNSPVHCLQTNSDLWSGGDWSVASGHNNGTISVWNMRTGSLQAVLSSPLCCPVWHIQFRENTIYTSSCNNLHAWNLNQAIPTNTNQMSQLTCSKIFKGHTKSIKHFQVKENRMVSGGMDNKIKVWDLEKPGSSYLYTLAGHTGSVDWLEFKKDKLISCSADHTIRVWSFWD